MAYYDPTVDPDGFPEPGTDHGFIEYDAEPYEPIEHLVLTMLDARRVATPSREELRSGNGRRPSCRSPAGDGDATRLVRMLESVTAAPLVDDEAATTAVQCAAA
jgi:hypothetical protein